ncbi:MAG TPA: extracellular solute-binding protein [Acidimicrobiia bacterium]|nr:extracellular solute-binding protein [Acidimicrobiia bacterium]
MAGPGEPNPSSGLTRRGFLRGAGLGAAGLAIGGPSLLAACSRGSAKPVRSEVRVVNQPLMLDDNTPGLILRAGLNLTYSEYTDAATFVAQHRAAFAAHRDVGADVVVLPDAQAAQLVASQWVRAIALPGARARVLPALANPAFDPGRTFSIPYVSTMIGIAYDTRRLPSGVDSAGALFDSTYEGKVVLAADPAATLGFAMLASGQDPSKVTAAQAAAAVTRVRAAVASGQVRGFATTNAVDDVASGNALLALARAADVRTARVLSPHVRFVVPREGGLLSSTNMVIPVGARSVGAAQRFIDYMSSPDPNARLSSFVNVISPVAGGAASLQGIDVKAAADPLIVPPPAVWKRLRIWGATSETASAEAELSSLAASHSA